MQSKISMKQTSEKLNKEDIGYILSLLYKEEKFAGSKGYSLHKIKKIRRLLNKVTDIYLYQ